jgi:hypothetical protein
MSLALSADYAADSIVSGNTAPRWREVNTGLKVALLGYLASTAGAALALFLLSLAVRDWAGPLRTTGRPGDVPFLLLVGVAAAALVSVAGYGLLLIGQWCCLVYAPAHPGAREMMLGCATCFVLGLVLHMIAPFLGGGQFYEAWQDGLDELKTLDLVQGSGLVHLAGCGLWLVSVMAFTQYLRGVSACFNDAGQARSLDAYLVAVSLLLGASIGLPLCVQRLGSRMDLLGWLAVGWLLCFVWYLLLIARVRGCILQGLRAGGEPQEEAEGWEAGRHPPHTLSGLHRICRVNAPK